MNRNEDRKNICMQELNEFQNHIKAAITCYLRSRRGKEISQDRLNDIARIQKIISISSFDYKQPKKTLSNYINKMCIGWFIFKTGKSKLKKSIQDEMNKFKNNRSRVLLTPNGKIPMTKMEMNKNHSFDIGFFSPILNTTIQADKDTNSYSTREKERINRNTITHRIFSFLR
jgi:hypothetical protein